MTTATECKPPKVLSPETIKKLEAAHQFIVDNYSTGKTPRLLEVAAVAGISPFHFHRLFLYHFGYTPKQKMTGQQIENAKRLILDGVKLDDAATQSGFATQSHFSARFRQAEGCSPREWMFKQKKEMAADPTDRADLVEHDSNGEA